MRRRQGGPLLKQWLIQIPSVLIKYPKYCGREILQMKMKRILSMLAATAIMASSAAVMGVSADETTPTNGADYSEIGRAHV